MSDRWQDNSSPAACLSGGHIVRMSFGGQDAENSGGHHPRTCSWRGLGCLSGGYVGIEGCRTAWAKEGGPRVPQGSEKAVRIRVAKFSAAASPLGTREGCCDVRSGTQDFRIRENRKSEKLPVELRLLPKLEFRQVLCDSYLRNTNCSASWLKQQSSLVMSFISFSGKILFGWKFTSKISTTTCWSLPQVTP